MGTDTPYTSMSGDRFVELLRQMGARVRGDKLSDEQFSPIHQFLLSHPNAKYGPELVGFLKDILRTEEYQARGFIVTGAADFVRKTRDCRHHRSIRVTIATLFRIWANYRSVSAAHKVIELIPCQ